MIGNRDKRIWTPDETCEPFQLATCGNIGTGTIVMEFRVPTGTIAVVRKLFTFASAGNTAKEAACLRFRQSGHSRGLMVLAELSGLPLSGVLQSVYERGTIAGDNIPGWIFTANNQPFDVCIVFGPGDWQAFNGGSGGVGAAGIVALSGYTFPQSPRG